MLLTINNSETTSQDRGSSWCIASIKDAKKRVKIVHMGRGKFRVISDEEGNRYAENIIVDASDVFHFEE